MPRLRKNASSLPSLLLSPISSIVSHLFYCLPSLVFSPISSILSRLCFCLLSLLLSPVSCFVSHLFYCLPSLVCLPSLPLSSVTVASDDLCRRNSAGGMFQFSATALFKQGTRVERLF